MRDNAEVVIVACDYRRRVGVGERQVIKMLPHLKMKCSTVLFKLATGYTTLEDFDDDYNILYVIIYVIFKRKYIFLNIF